MNLKGLQAFSLEVQILYSLWEFSDFSEVRWFWMAARSTSDYFKLVSGVELSGQVLRKLLNRLYAEGLVDKQRGSSEVSGTAQQLNQKSVVRFRLNKKGYQLLRELGIPKGY